MAAVGRYWRPFWRIGLGTIVILAGVLMLVLPGPGILTIIAGLAIMADEFPPAKRLLHYMRRRFDVAVDKVRHRVRDEERKGEPPLL